MAPLISPLSKDLKEGREVTHAFLGKRIPDRCQVPKSWGSYVSGCHSSWNRMARVGSSGSLVELTMRPDPAGAHNRFLCIFLWGRWRTTGGFEQRRLQSKKIMAQDEDLGPLLLSPESQLIVLRVNIWPQRNWANYWWSQSKLIPSPKSELNTRYKISQYWGLNEKVI